MRIVFWLLALFGLSAIAFVQLGPNLVKLVDPRHSTLATGMPPQIALIKSIASKNGWEISCTGSAGEMTVIRLLPSFSLPLPVSSEELWDELTPVATSLKHDANSNLEETSCDLPANHFELSVDPEDEPVVMGVGPRDYLEPFLEIAEQCDVRGAKISPIEIEEQLIVEGELPAGSLGLIVDPAQEARTGPIMCLGLLSHRLEQISDTGQ